MSDSISGRFLSPQVRNGEATPASLFPSLGSRDRLGGPRDVVVKLIFENQDGEDEQEGIIYLDSYQAKKLGVRLIELSADSQSRRK
ncbi:hypothetical protein Q31b_41920 [Novipirellula aureliae]|uniref:Uncharacterized protein n=1 Tax=Novipirellula aureliae TaxID=2527966 RepID=A0A5C6DWA3_9BACT|nr:hypothetical protein Q31b_41920 [Novipirellula aureliae]